MGLGGVAIAILPSTICLKLTFSDGLGGSTQPLCNNQELIYTIPKHNGERIVHRRETRHCFLYSCGFRIG